MGKLNHSHAPLLVSCFLCVVLNLLNFASKRHHAATMPEKYFETFKFRPRVTKEKGYGYWYDIEKSRPEKTVLAEGRYKEYHNQTMARFNRVEAHENRPEMLQCDKTMTSLNTCLSKHVDTAKQGIVAPECKDFMEQFKKNCGLRRFENLFVNYFFPNRLPYVQQVYLIFRHDVI